MRCAGIRALHGRRGITYSELGRRMGSHPQRARRAMRLPGEWACGLQAMSFRDTSKAAIRAAKDFSKYRLTSGVHWRTVAYAMKRGLNGDGKQNPHAGKR